MVRVLEHDLLGFWVTIPPLDGLDIHRAELPFLEWAPKTLHQAAALFRERYR
jgi:hypothetical protein